MTGTDQALKIVIDNFLELQEISKQLVLAQGRMLEKWADEDDKVKEGLWKDLHDKGAICRDALAKYNVLP